MKIEETALPGVLLISPAVYRDDRGCFYETWNQKRFEDAGLPAQWVQDNFSLSTKNVIRGIHYQIVQPQAKLVRVTYGAAWDVAVDLRRSSPNFGRHVAVELHADDGKMLYIPQGFGHGFAALTDHVAFAYKVNDYYCPTGERTIVWNDIDMAIPWPVAGGEAVVSDKDRQGPKLRDAETFA